MFSKFATVIGAGALLFSGLASAADPKACESGPWTDVHAIGNAKITHQWCDTKHAEGIPITGIEAWANEHTIQAVQFYFADGTAGPQIGMPDNDGTSESKVTKKHQRIDWDMAGNQIKQVKLWGNGKGTSLGRIQIRTDKEEFDVGKLTGKQQAFDIKVNSGILLGAYGGVKDSTVEVMGFLFLKSEIKSMSVENFQTSDTPEQLNEKMQGLQEMTSHEAHYSLEFKNLSSNSWFGMDATYSTSKSIAIANSHTITAGGSWSAKGSVLGIAEVTSTYSLSYAYARTDTETNEQTSSTTFKYQIVVSSVGTQDVWCRATAWYGKYEGEWTGQVVLELEDGDKFTYMTKGTVKDTKWGQVNAECQEKPFDNALPKAPAPDSTRPQAPPGKRAVALIG
ncbi:hypothetical protein BDV95DRAFT_608132 [Massariosphaeria phaeospora]|uniref:Jacalin-type lectin domain-containing protein n=1 Tax=Massariosphaeria phaeospora TaxID=100035 RepID=A0A7C8I7E7_9PLEO|nr:hypothetical protein BDV95DRAFT_608132 [Massariosphaeria phaeospora]